MKRNTLIVAAMLIVGIILISLSLPRNTDQMGLMLSYEVNKPWRNPTLIAPFDIPLEYDEVTQARISDSIEANFVHFYKHDAQLGYQQVALLNKALSQQSAIPATMRSRLTNALTQVYRDGIVDTKTYEQIQAGRMRQVSIRDDGTNATLVSTDNMHSVKRAYEMIDSAVSDLPQHDLLQQIDIATYIQPNYTVDEQNEQLLKDAKETALIPPAERAVQLGEAIIFTGNVVTPEKDAIIKTYQRKLEENAKKRMGSDEYILLGQTVIVAILMLVFYVFIRLMRPRVFSNLRKMTFLITIMTLMAVAVLWIVKFRPNYMYIIPFAMVPIIVSTFLDARTSFFVHLIVVLICSLVAREQAAFIIMQFLAGAIAVASMQELTRRSQLVRCAAFIFAIYCVSYVALELVRGLDFHSIDWRYIMYFAVNCIVLSFAYVGIFLVEKTFGFTSTVTLVELSDISTPVLRKLSDNCPGTFQHALQVANIAQEAAVKIGASSRLVRAGALYHDIGKVENPAFFTENQNGVNPHDALSPEQSARIVIQHVTDGVRLAERARLPQVIKDMILQHHGLGKTKYFYNLACKAHPDQEIDPAPYSYPGPNPQTREAAIVMMADGCEAAAKSLQDYSEQSITTLVNRIIDGQIADGLLRDSPISFRDVETVKRVFIDRLISFYHTRISYPDDIQPKPKDE